MSSVNYSRLARTAKRLIDRFGGEVTFVVNTPSANAQAWKAQPVSTTEIKTSAIFTKEDERYQNGELVQSAKQKVLFYKVGTTFDPNMTGHLKRGSEVWKFSNIKSVNPAGTVIIYTAEVTR